MRIAIFSESYEPVINGVSVAVTTLRDELARRGHEVFVFAPAFEAYVDQYANTFRFPSRRTPFARDYPLPIPISGKLHRVFDNLDLDVVHTQTPFLLGWLGASWAKRRGVPLVSTNHTLYTEYAHYARFVPSSITRRFLVGLMRRYYSRCSAVVVPSKPVEKILRSYGVQTRMEVIKTGVAAIGRLSPEERKRARESCGVTEDDQVLLYVGRIAPEKNIGMLLQAFKMVLAEHERARLILVGGGPALEDVKRLASDMKVADRTRFMGMMPREDIHPIYSCADIFVFPSVTETQGIAICEALSAGLPAVAVDAGGIPENVQPGGDGFLTRNDPAEFADRICFLIANDSCCADMSVRARANAACFSVERMAESFERVYASLVTSVFEVGR